MQVEGDELSPNPRRGPANEPDALPRAHHPEGKGGRPERSSGQQGRSAKPASRRELGETRGLGTERYIWWEDRHIQEGAEIAVEKSTDMPIAPMITIIRSATIAGASEPQRCPKCREDYIRNGSYQPTPWEETCHLLWSPVILTRTACCIFSLSIELS